jgi:glycerol-3-phosphate dehydrogenase (NAD(P)+)
VLSAVKGIEEGTCERVSQIVATAWEGVEYAAVSGPSFSGEVLAGQPTAVVVASVEDGVAARAQELLHRPEFRVYRTEDLVGVELGGALKNVYAIAAGACAGLGLGENSRAALITRALAEMARVGGAFGGRLETFLGLGGAGDLMLTCYGQSSRNRTFGEALGRGQSLAQAQERSEGIVEGVTTVRAAKELADRYGVEAPLLNAVDRLVHGGESPVDILRSLLARPPVEERRVAV